MSFKSNEKNERGVPRSDHAYKFIIDGIREGRLVPGTRLREIELADQMNLSRTPVREALGRLQVQGLAVNDPDRGLIITEPDYAMTSELYAMREVLEGTAARLAARHASDVEIDFLNEINQRDAELTTAEELAENNRLFHGTLYQCAHNRYLLKTLSSLQESMMLLGATTLAHPDRPKAARKEHQAIIEALRKRNQDEAEAAARQHIISAYRIRLGSLLQVSPVQNSTSL